MHESIISHSSLEQIEQNAQSQCLQGYAKPVYQGHVSAVQVLVACILNAILPQ